MQYVTNFRDWLGDTHQSIDIHKLNSSNFKIEKELNRNDILIIAGDAGFVWTYGKAAKGEEKFWRDWLSKKPYTIFCTCGNHENYNLIEEFPVVDFCGGRARKITENLYYEIRGEIYNFGEKTFLSFGGAESHDKEFRKEGISWWTQESITEKDYQNALNNLKKYNNKVDYIISHTGGFDVCSFLGFQGTISDSYLTRILMQTDYKTHYCGHYHLDRIVDDKTRILYDDIIEIY